MSAAGEPRTKAGRALLDRLGELPKLMPYDSEAVDAILAIEDAARQTEPRLDVGRLEGAIAEAMNHVPWPGERGSITFGGMTFAAAARAIAAAYEAAASEEGGS